MIEEFVYVGSWFEEKYKKNLDARYFTFKVALNYFLQHKLNNIIETGCQRLVDDWGGGCSTLIFGNFCVKYNKQLWTVDLNYKNLEVAKQATSEYKSHITYCLNDSIAFLEAFDKPIDFLYLDSFDCSIDPLVGSAPAQQHQLAELKIALPKLTPHAIISLDDNNFPDGGKTKLSKAHLLNNGWLCLLDFQQSLWIRKI